MEDKAPVVHGRVLITGANGFIGSHLCDAFAEKGYEVFGLVRRSSDLRFLRDAKVRLVYGDLTELEAIELPETLEVIVHAAALVSDNATRQQCHRHIYSITVGLFEGALSRYPALRKFVYISTALTLGYGTYDISESRPGRSAAYVPYNDMKRQTEDYLFERHRETGFPVVVLRPGDVYGPRDRTSCELMLRAAEGGTPLIVGSGRHPFGLCCPANLCQAALAAVQRPAANGRAYTVTNRVAPTWREFFAALQEGIGKPQRIYVPVSLSLAVALLFELIKRLFPGFIPPINLYRIRRITTATTYDLSRTIEELDYDPDDDYPRQFAAIVAWYREEKARAGRPS